MSQRWTPRPSQLLSYITKNTAKHPCICIFFGFVRKYFKKISRGRFAYSKGMIILKVVRCRQTAPWKPSPMTALVMRLFSLGVNLTLTYLPSSDSCRGMWHPHPCHFGGFSPRCSIQHFACHQWMPKLGTDSICQVCCKYFSHLLFVSYLYVRCLFLTDVLGCDDINSVIFAFPISRWF